MEYLKLTDEETDLVYFASGYLYSDWPLVSQRKYSDRLLRLLLCKFLIKVHESKTELTKTRLYFNQATRWINANI